MFRNALFVFLASALIVGFVACPAPEQAEKPPAEQPPMTEEQQLQFVKDNCVCKTCPSWTPACDEKGEWGGFCAVGKSQGITEENGCICPECPVAKKLDLKWGYYCTRGSAEEQAAAEMEKEKMAGEEKEGMEEEGEAKTEGQPTREAKPPVKKSKGGGS